MIQNDANFSKVYLCDLLSHGKHPPFMKLNPWLPRFQRNLSRRDHPGGDGQLLKWPRCSHDFQFSCDLLTPFPVACPKPDPGQGPISLCRTETSRVSQK